MRPRIAVFIVLCALHLALTLSPLWWSEIELIAPFLAGMIYAPLWGMHTLGLPVYAESGTGWWKSPSVLGWSLVMLLWLAVWWGLAGLAAKFFRKRPSNI